MTRSATARSPGPRYRIGVVSRMAGVPAHSIRVWERRYGAVAPDRSAGGGREFTDADVTRLRMLKRALDAGHAIGEVARLSDTELGSLLSESPAPPLAPSADADRIRHRFLDAIFALDTVFAEQLLSRAGLVLSPRQLVHQVVAPLLEEIGERWDRGELRVAHEHAATGLLRNLLGTRMCLQVPEIDAPTAVATTLPGERHELGALMAAMLAAVQGWRVVYLGADLPLAEIVHGARRTRAEAVLVSVVLDPGDVVEALADLRGRLPEGTRILAGGRGLPEQVPPGVEPIAGLDELERRLRAG